MPVEQQKPVIHREERGILQAHFDKIQTNIRYIVLIIEHRIVTEQICNQVAMFHSWALVAGLVEKLDKAEQECPVEAVSIAGDLDGTVESVGLGQG
jgi:hypothetical protein